MHILIETAAHVGRITLNRPERHNAFDETMITELAAAISTMADDPAVRVVVLAASGRSFCSGADLEWMQRAAGYGIEENRRDAAELAELLRRIAECPKPVIARVQGPAYGGGVGVVAACDFAVAIAEAKFALTEVRLGLVPAVIGPHVIAAVGARQARRYMLSAEAFPAAEAQRIGLVHEIAADAAGLDAVVDGWIDAIGRNGPQALAECKALVRAVADRPLDRQVIDHTVDCIARLRASPEGREGLAAFLGKRPPDWMR